MKFMSNKNKSIIGQSLISLHLQCYYYLCYVCIWLFVTFHSASGQLLSTSFQKTSVTRRESITLIFGFHQTIANFLVSLTFSVTCKNTQDINMQSINYWTHAPIIGCCTFCSISYWTSNKLCGIVSYIIGLIDPLDIFAEYRRDVLPSKPVVQ